MKVKDQQQTKDRLLLDVDEAAALLGTTRRQLYKLARSHEVPAVYIGRFLKFRRESLERWIEEREAGR